MLVERWLRFVVHYRWAVLAVAAAALVAAGVLARGLHKDTSANAYIEPGNPALLYRERVVDTFGLKEPIVIAVRSSAPGGILTPEGLRYVRLIVERLEAVPNIDLERITSLASRSAISGGVDGLEVAPLLPAGEIDAAMVDRVRGALDGMPIYDGTLVSKDRSATIIAAEMLDEKRNAETYQAVLDLSRALPARPGVQVFVAGAGAITGYFSSYIDRDAGRLVPFTAIAVALVLFCAFLTIRSAALPMLIAAATVVATLGIMAASGVAFYAITNGMVVVLIGISVAEPMHVFGEYYSLLQERPQEPNVSLVVKALQNVWRPIALTSFTTVVGFLSLWATSTMPPIRYFGLFGAFGVTVAWLLTVSWLPAAMSLLPRKPSRLMNQATASDPIGRAVLALGAAVTRRPRAVLVASGVVCVVALLAATLVRVDHARIENFNASEPLYIADREINRTLAGTNPLDIVIETRTDEGVLKPETLRKIDRLQQYVSSLEGVGAATSIVDYVKQLNRAVEEGSEASYVIPDDQSLIAQLMLTYQASAAPTEFQSLLDSSARTALIRVWLRADRWSEQRKVVLAAQRYIEREFGGDESVTATLTGRVMLDYEWVQSVASGHTLSVMASTLSVLFMCVVIFRSFRDGLLCLAPLFVSVVLVYAVMGLADIWLGVATSMFAAIAIGLGIDLAIHMVARARKAERMELDTDARILYVYQSSGRAVLFNATAVGVGFGILTLSAAPPIRMFGILVATAIVGAFVAALTVLPALLKVMMSNSAPQLRRRASDRALEGLMPAVALAIVFAAALRTAPVHAADTDANADRIMQALAARPEGASADRTVRIKLIDRHGSVREQLARALRKNVADGRRMAIFYLAPANIRGTSFLVFDYSAPDVANDQWLYLPALRKVRRIPAADRGDYFLGTDLTFDEIRNDNRVTLGDWQFRSIGGEEVDGAHCEVIEGVAASEQVSRELGYARARWCVDERILIARRIEYWDRGGTLLKTLINREPKLIDSVWSASRIEVKNHKTGHGTVLEFESSRFDGQVPDMLLTQQQMERGL